MYVIRVFRVSATCELQMLQVAQMGVMECVRASAGESEAAPESPREYSVLLKRRET